MTEDTTASVDTLDPHLDLHPIPQSIICEASSPSLPLVNGSQVPIKLKDDMRNRKLGYVVIGHDEMHHVQTNNHINAFLHAIDFSLDHNRSLIIVEHSWVFRSLAQLFEISQQDWMDHFGISTISKRNMKDIHLFDTIFKTGDEMYFYHTTTSRDTLKSRRMEVLKYLWTHPSVEICSMFREHDLVPISASNYVVIHSRWMQHNGCLNRLGNFAYKLHNQTGIKIDRRASCLLEPSYIKSILRTSGFMYVRDPIYIIGDGLNPNVAINLQNDTEIGDRIHIIPDRQSSVGRDMMLAVLSSVFIGTPISTLSGNVARARIAFGKDPHTNFLFAQKHNRSLHDEWDFICQSMQCLIDDSFMQNYVG